MNIDWLNDWRKTPDDVMDYIRVAAVYAIREKGMSPEVIAKAYNIGRSSIYKWLRLYDQGGYDALETKSPPGAETLITSEMDEWLKAVVLESTPTHFGYDTNLWTVAILGDLLKKEFHVNAGESTIRLHLKALGLSCQQPEYRDNKRDESEIDKFLNVKFPKIQRLAENIGADIGFEDESGIGVMTRHGRTWGLKGHTPIIECSMDRGGYNVLSIVTPEGEMEYRIEEGSINGDKFIDFLQHIIENREHPLILMVDHASFHSSKKVRDFVRVHRHKIRIFFLPKRAPEYNPDEQVWNEIKNNQIGKQPVKDKKDLNERLIDSLNSLKGNVNRIASFFHTTETNYASCNVC